MNMGQYEELQGLANVDPRPPCRKCNGTGRFITHAGRDFGDCYACSGSGRWGKVQTQAATIHPVTQVPLLMFPKTVDIVLRNNIKLNLGHSRIVMTQDGRLCLVSVRFGMGFFGTFDRTGEFRPNNKCTPEMIATLRDVEERGLEAVKEIGRLTGVCCVCSRTLTDDRSIADGIGPICSGRMV